MRSYGALPPQGRDWGRVVIHRNLAWTLPKPRHKRRYYDTADVEYVEELIEELMRDDDKSYLARPIEYSDAEDQKTF